MASSSSAAPATAVASEGGPWVVCRDFPNYEVSAAGLARNSGTGKVLKPSTVADKYMQVKLYSAEDGAPRSVSVHRLVATAFLPNPDSLATVNHKDNDRSNNAVTNLEWMTQSDQNRKEHRRTANMGGDKRVAVWQCDARTGERIRLHASVTAAAEAVSVTRLALTQSFWRAAARDDAGAGVNGGACVAYGYRWEKARDKAANGGQGGAVRPTEVDDGSGGQGNDDAPPLEEEAWARVNSALEVSNQGRARRNGRVVALNSTGEYRRVDVGGGKLAYVHTLVATAFVKNEDPATRTSVMHLNGDRHNNAAKNLAWATRSEMMKHAYDTGRNSKRRRVAQIGDGDVVVKEHESVRAAADAMGVKSLNSICVAIAKGNRCGGFRWRFA